MSKTQFVEFSNRGFWAYDVALGIFLKHLVDAGENPEHAAIQWVQDALPKWRAVIAAAGSGLGWRIDEGWLGSESGLFLQLAQEATRQLASRASIPVAEMEEWAAFDGLENVSRGVPVVLTAPIVELGEAIHRLLQGPSVDPPHGKYWLYGTPTGRMIV
ncbi:MAG: hypothetical protein K1Y01_04530 [Vicinamibacteria bacterium]|nr:hypothetical protein [Vicinamibacteria bacterium]